MNITPLPPKPVVVETEELWDEDSIQAVIRAANQRGVCPQVLFNEPKSRERFSSFAPTVRIG